MRVLVACEFSGVVREAFKARGHDAWSCDLLPTEIPGQHIQGDIFKATYSRRDFDLMIAFPPCTRLCVSGARWFKQYAHEQELAVQFFLAIASLPFERIAIENPIGIMSRRWRKPDQIIQPWQFGHGETKATCLWLKNLPCLRPTHIDGDLFAKPAEHGREQRIHRMPPSDNRSKERSRTYHGIAQAMADQWQISTMTAHQCQRIPANLAEATA